MQYTRLGNSGLIVSRLAFGAMTFGSGRGPMAAVSKVDQKLANEMVAKSIDAGINFFNTADAYTGGESERMLAAALGNRRKDVVITTKVGFRTGEALIHTGLSRAHILSNIEDSLRRLNSDYVDVYIVHRLDRYTPLEETLDALDMVVRQGKARYIGFSNWPGWLAGKAVGLQQAGDLARFRAAELYYSLVGRDVEHELVPLLEDAGIGMLVWSPLSGGFLTGKYTRENRQADGGRLTGFDVLPVDREKGFDLIDAMRPIADAHHTSIASIALAWLITKPAVASILVGASKMSQLESNLEATNIRMSNDEIALLDSLTEPRTIYPNWFNRNINDEPVRRALDSTK
jgi:aryl-alcohol dehydrogenase-like predicted oxidoreductase